MSTLNHGIVTYLELLGRFIQFLVRVNLSEDRGIRSVEVSWILLVQWQDFLYLSRASVGSVTCQFPDVVRTLAPPFVCTRALI